MAKNTLKWLDTEYCGTADTTIQPVLVNDTILYTLYDNKGKELFIKNLIKTNNFYHFFLFNLIFIYRNGL